MHSFEVFGTKSQHGLYYGVPGGLNEAPGGFFLTILTGPKSLFLCPKSVVGINPKSAAT